MEIRDIRITRVGDGILFSVGYFLQVSEELEQEDIASLYSVFQEAAQRFEPKKDAADDGPRRSRTAAPANPSEASSGGRARRRDAEPSPASSVPETTPDVPSSGSPSRRRRAGAAAPDAGSENMASASNVGQTTSTPPAGSSTGGGQADPPTRRRRGGDALPAAAVAESPATDHPPAGETRRRRGAAPTTSTEETTSPSKLSDADLSKAASEGARALTPKGVMDIIKSFGVDTVGALKGEQRREFVNKVNAAIEVA